MAKKIALTPAAIDALTSDSITDLSTPGLAIEVLRSGKSGGVIDGKLRAKKLQPHCLAGSFLQYLFPRQGHGLAT
jgi:hypothetical protein